MSQILYRNIAPRGIMLLILIALLPQLSSCSEEKKEPSYKASTVEECINEEACVWYAFEGIAFGDEGEKAQYRKIRKRLNSLEIVIMTSIRKDHRFLLDNFIEKLRLYLPFEITLNEGGTGDLFIFNSDNPISELDKRFKPLILKLDETGRIFNLIFSSFKGQNLTCFGHGFLNKENGEIGLAFVFLNWNFFDECMEEEVVQMLGLPNDIRGFEFSTFNDSEIVNMTDLDWFLLKILYDKRLKAGMTVSDVKKIFSKIYQYQLTEMEKNNDQPN